MDVDEVRTCLRALLSSTAFSYSLKSLLNDFRNMTGFDLPLFGCAHPVEFLKTLNDTIQLIGDPYNPQVALIESKKSAHITSLVDRQRNSIFQTKCSNIFKQRRIIIPDGCKKEDSCLVPELPSHKNLTESMTSEQNIFRFGSFPSKPDEPLFKIALDKPPSERDALRQQKSTQSLLEKNNVTNPSKAKNLFNGSSNSVPNKDFIDTEKERAEKCSDTLKKKTDSCYFGDNDRNSNNKDPSNSSDSVVNESIKNKFRKLLKNHPEGLWCCELPQLFLEEFNYVLDYKEFGYTSLIQMLSELTDVFRFIRPGNGDWILFDASVPPTPKEKKMKNLESATEINCEIKRNFRQLLLNCDEWGVELNKIGDLYYKMFGNSLDFQSLGFKDLRSLLETWEDDFLKLINVNGKTFIVQGVKRTVPSSIPWEEAIPPITEENDIFAEIFPKDVVGPEESLSELDLMRHVAVGNMVEVSIAEVWSPTEFYLQLHKFKKRLNGFMDDLQNFYNLHLHKYKMPDSTIRPNQVCVGLYNSDPDIPEEWHRAQIVKVINEKTVLINFVDYGTVARVKKSQLRFLHRSFQSFPIQAFLAQMSGIAPPNNETKWSVSTSKRFLELTRVAYLRAEIIDIDFKVPSMSVTLFDPFQKWGISINQKLVLEKLAVVKEPLYEDPFPEEAIDSRPPNLKASEKQKKGLNGISPDMTKQENLTKNLPELRDEFSDIADLGQTTLFHFKMKSLTLEDSLPIQKKNECSKPLLNSDVSFEFEEVPDLEKCEKKEVIEKIPEKKVNEEVIKSDVFENEENPFDMKGISLIQQTVRRLNPRQDEKLKQPSQIGVAMQQTSSSPSGKPSRLPPGLEHMNILPNFNQTQFCFSPDDYKKMVNVLAMELLTRKPSIKQVGMTNPALALEIAKEMAEAYIASQYPGRVPYNLDSRSAQSFADALVSSVACQPNVLKAEESTEPVIPIFPVSPPATKLSETSIPLNEKKEFICSEQYAPQISSTKEQKPNEYVKPTQIGDKTLHLVTIDGRMYFCAEEIVRKFTLISNREIADRVLHMKKFQVNYRIICKSTDERALNAIKSSDLPICKGKSKKLKIYLIPLAEVLPLLRTLGCMTKPFEEEFLVRMLQTPLFYCLLGPNSRAALIQLRHCLLYFRNYN